MISLDSRRVCGRRGCAAFLLVLGLAAAPFSPGQTYWGAGAGNFNAGSNWVGGVFPAANAIAAITNNGVAYLSNNPPNQVAELWVASGGGSTATMFQSGGALSVTNWFLVGRSGGGASYGTYTMSGGTLTKSGAGGFYIGDVGGSVGTMSLSGNAQVINDGVGAIQIGTGNSAAGGTGTLNLAGNSFLGAGKTNLFIGFGQKALGTMNMSGGTALVGRVFMGLGNPSANGLLYLSGGTMWKTGGQVFAIGADGATGRVVQSGGEMLISNGFVSVGYNGNGRGFYRLDGGLLASGNGQDFNLSDQSGTRGYFTMGGGSAVVSRLFIAKTSNTVGTLVLSGGVFRLVSGGTSYEPPVGGYTANDWSSYGSIRMEGGYFEIARNIQIGAYGRGSLEINNGTMAYLTGSWPVIARRGGSFGVVTVSGGLWQQQGTANHFIVGELGTAVLNIRGTGVVDGGTALWIGNGAGATGTVNLAGGVLLVPGVTEGNASAVSALNFHGGTLRTKADSATFLQGIDAAYVYGGGAVLDSAGYNITASQNLLAPDGNGLLNIPVTAGGAGFDGPPIVLIAGGGGSGATAIAQVNAAGAVTNILITNPGRGYTSTPTVTLLGGGGSNVTFGIITLGANASGGLTKQGAGILTLTGNNTYTGRNVVAGGTLLFSGTNAMGGGDVDARYGTVVGATSSLDQVFVARMANVSSGTLALVAANANSLDFGVPGLTNLSLGSIGTNGYSGTLTAAGGNYRLGGAGGTLVVSSSLAGANGLILNGSGTTGTVILAAANTYSGDTVVNPGILKALDANAIPGGLGASGGGSLVVFNGGVLGLGASDFLRPLGTTTADTRFAASGGFAAYGADRLVDFGGAGAGVTWASGNFVPAGSTLFFGAPDATHGVTLANAIDFNAGQRTIQVNDGAATVDAAVTNVLSNGGLTKTGAGRLLLGDANTYAGPTLVNGGAIRAGVLANGGSPSSIGQSSADRTNLVLAGATLEYTGPSVSLDRGYTLGAGANVIDTANDLAFAGAVDAASGASFRKLGAGALSHLNAGSNLIANALGVIYVVDEGTVNFAGGPSSVYQVNGEIAVGTTAASAGRLNLSNGTLRSSSWISVGRGNGTSGLASSLNVYGGTLEATTAAMGYSFTTVNYLAKPEINLYGSSTMRIGGLFYVAESSGAWATLRVADSAQLQMGGDLVVGRTGGARGKVEISGGGGVLASRLWLGGEAADAVGAVYQSGGWLSTTGGVSVDHFSIGRTAGGSGYYALSGGAVTALEANIGFNGYGIWAQTGGEARPRDYFTVGRGTGTGMVHVAGGSLYAPANGVWVGWSGRGVLTVDDGGQLVSPATNLWLANSGAAGGIVNLNGGTAQVLRVVRGAGAGGGTINFDGGTLKAGSADAADFLQGLTAANVYGGGLTVDTDGRSLTIGQALLAPAGQGVVSIPVTAGGAGYIAAPWVEITGGGGAGATALAQIDPASGAVTGVLVTSRGTGFTSLPTVMLAGGGGSNATLGAASVAANVSGGLTKTGTGTLTLAGASTYSGVTVINQGTLALAASGSISNTPSIGVAAGAVFDVSAKTGFQILAGQTIQGDGAVVGAVTFAAGSILSPGSSPGTLTFSNNLTLAASATYYVELVTTAAYDRIVLAGGSALDLTAGPTLALDLTAYAGSLFDQYTIVQGGWSGASGTFAGLSDMAVVTNGVRQFLIDYGAGSGSDIVLTEVPEPGTLGLLGLAAALAAWRRRRA